MEWQEHGIFIDRSWRARLRYWVRRLVLRILRRKDWDESGLFLMRDGVLLSRESAVPTRAATDDLEMSYTITLGKDG